MKAIVRDTYGPPDVLRLEEVEKPTPTEDQVLVEVRAASVNPQDWHLLRGEPILVRMFTGWLKPKNRRLGGDIAGRVVAVGRNVERFRPGDEVFGEISAHGGGAFAEYVSVPEGALVPKPANLTYEQAAAVPGAALAALQGLRDQGRLQPGQRVLINGASGGVGTFAVQIARWLGAKVTGVCSTRNVDMVRSLGADHVIDYTQGDFTENGQRYDLILDNVGNPATYKRLFSRSLEPAGIAVIVAGSFFLRLFLGPWMSMTGKSRILTYMTVPNQRDLSLIKELLESGRLAPVLDRRYTFAQVPEAVRYLEKGHAQGKVVIAVAKAEAE